MSSLASGVMLAIAIMIFFVMLFICAAIGTTIGVALQAISNRKNPVSAVTRFWGDVL